MSCHVSERAEVARCCSRLLCYGVRVLCSCSLWKSTADDSLLGGSQGLQCYDLTRHRVESTALVQLTRYSCTTCRSQARSCTFWGTDGTDTLWLRVVVWICVHAHLWFIWLRDGWYSPCSPAARDMAGGCERARTCGVGLWKGGRNP